MKSIGCSQTRTSLAESDGVTDLVKGSQRLPGALGVTLGRQGVRVDFPESEFFIHTKDDPASAQCRVTFTAVLRAAPPSLSTWWCDSELSAQRRDPRGAPPPQAATPLSESNTERKS